MQCLFSPTMVDDQFGFERCSENGIGVIIVENHYIFGVATREIDKMDSLVAENFARNFDGP